MGKNINRLFVLIVLPMLVLSCITPLDNPDEPDNPNNPNNPGNPTDPNIITELIPLSVGNQWNYHFTAPTVDEYHVYKIEELAPFTIGSTIYPIYLMTGPTIGYGAPFSLFLDYSIWGFFHDANGFNKLIGEGAEDKTGELWFKYPCSAGDTYGDYSVGSLNYNITNDHLGTSYECIQYIFHTENYQNEFYVYPGLGIIRADFYDQSLTFELTGYIIN